MNIRYDKAPKFLCEFDNMGVPVGQSMLPLQIIAEKFRMLNDYQAHTQRRGPIERLGITFG